MKSLDSRYAYTFSLFLCFPILISAASNVLDATSVHASYMYKGEQITAQNLHLLGTPLSPETVDMLYAMRPVLKAMCRNTSQEGDQEFIAKNLGTGDTTVCNGRNITIQYASFLLKVSGFSNRLQSMLITKNIWPGQLFRTKSNEYIVLHEGTYKAFSEVLPILIPTYQTASRKIRYLRCDELISQQGLKLVAVPKISLYLLNEGEGPHDENCVSVETKVSGKPLERSALNIHFSKKHVKELFILVEGVGIWTLIKGHYDLKDSEKGDWYIDDIFIDENGVLHLVDLEQPNNSDPERAFDPTDIEHHGNIKSGIEHLAVLCAHDPKKIAYLLKLVQESKKINSSNFSGRFKREIYSILEQVQTADKPGHKHLKYVK